MKSASEVAAAFLLLVGSLSGLRADVLTGPITNAATGHWYYLLSPTNRAAAEIEASNLGGHLATINNLVENEWAFTNFAFYASPPMGLWIGLTDADQEGVWRWADGDSSTFRLWAGGEPNNGSGFEPEEDNVVMRVPGVPDASYWNDVSGGSIHFGLVEVGGVLTPPTMIFVGPVTNANNGHIYYLLNLTNWAGAEAIAVGMGGHLATVNDAVENSFLFDAFAGMVAAPYGLFLGLNDVVTEGTWVWSSGSAASFLNWAPGEPNNFGDAEDYVVLRVPNDGAGGKWNDVSGNEYHYGIVEIGIPQVVASRIKVSVVDLCWQSSVTKRYQLQYNPNVATNAWVNVGGLIQGSGLEMCVPVDMPAGQAQKFFRVLQLE